MILLSRTGVKIKSTSVTSYIVIDSLTRQIDGIAKVNGKSSVNYMVVVTDNGEPGANDLFSLTLSNGYEASGMLTGGNIQLHYKCGESKSSDDKDRYEDNDEKDGNKNCDDDKNDDHNNRGGKH